MEWRVGGARIEKTEEQKVEIAVINHAYTQYSTEQRRAKVEIAVLNHV